MRKNLFYLVGLFLAVIFLVGCGERAEVPPGYVGKLQTENGLSDELIPESKFRLEFFCINCDDLILAEVADYARQEEMKVFIPKDKLNLTVDVRSIVTASKEKQNLNMVFRKMTAKPTENERVRIIEMSRMYSTYALPIIRETVRSELTKYSIEEIMNNRDSINERLKSVVREKLKKTPLSVVHFGLANIQPPSVILEAQEAAKERAIEIEKAEAQKLIDLKRAEAALVVAQKQQQVDLKEAETQVLVNKKLNESVNNAFVTQRMLKVMDKMADSDNKVFIITEEVLNNPAALFGPMTNIK